MTVFQVPKDGIRGFCQRTLHCGGEGVFRLDEENARVQQDSNTNKTTYKNIHNVRRTLNTCSLTPQRDEVSLPSAAAAFVSAGWFGTAWLWQVPGGISAWDTSWADFLPGWAFFGGFHVSRFEGTPHPQIIKHPMQTFHTLPEFLDIKLFGKIVLVVK